MYKKGWKSEVNKYNRLLPFDFIKESLLSNEIKDCDHSLSRMHKERNLHRNIEKYINTKYLNVIDTYVFLFLFACYLSVRLSDNTKR